MLEDEKARGEEVPMMEVQAHQNITTWGAQAAMKGKGKGDMSALMDPSAMA
jgi:hypothetical protein